MADPKNKVKDNISGNWYVDQQCIDCDLCRTTAPSNFTRNADAGYSYIFKQPETDEETGQSQKALSECPVEAIGNDAAPVFPNEMADKKSTSESIAN